MKKLFGYLGVAIISFFGGAAAGWMARKKTAEVQFEEVSAEEQAAQIAADLAAKQPVDVYEAINRTFGLDGKEKPSEAQEKASVKDADGDTDGDSTLMMNTQKEQYFKQWKAEEASVRKYDTRTNEEPKNPVISEEEDDLEAGIDNELVSKIIDGIRIKGGPDIEAGTMDDWDHWLGEPEGQYDPVEVWWFDEDNVLTDEHGEPLENPGKYMGFDVETKFEEISEETTGDPDIRVIYNHKENAIFQIVRKHMSYDRKTAMEEFGDDEEDEQADWIRTRHE